MLTARDAVADRIAALNAGADDYLVKPFAFEELLARIRAILRRVSNRASPILSHADLTLDPVSRKVVRAGVDISLTAREYALLQFLLEHAGEVVSRTRIVQAGLGPRLRDLLQRASRCTSAISAPRWTSPSVPSSSIPCAAWATCCGAIREASQDPERALDALLRGAVLGTIVLHGALVSHGARGRGVGRVARQPLRADA